jgi:hypothetical protein
MFLHFVSLGALFGLLSSSCPLDPQNNENKNRSTQKELTALKNSAKECDILIFENGRWHHIAKNETEEDVHQFGSEEKK